MSSTLSDDPLRNILDAFLSATERILDQFRARAAARSSESSTIPAQVIFQECCTDGFLQLVQLLGSLRNDLHSSNATWTIRGFESIDSCSATPHNHKNTDDADDPSLYPDCHIFDSISSRRTTAGQGNINGPHTTNGDSSSQCLLTLLSTSTHSEHYVSSCRPQRIPCDKAQWSLFDRPIDFTESLSLSPRDKKMITRTTGVPLTELVDSACSLYYGNVSATTGSCHSFVSPLSHGDREDCPSTAVNVCPRISEDSRASARLRTTGRALE